MLTDAPPRKANRAGFLESARIRTLDLPQDHADPRVAAHGGAGGRGVGSASLDALR